MTQATVEVVTPGDRRAAKEIHEGCYTGVAYPYEGQDWVAEAFARHRIAAITALQSAQAGEVERLRAENATLRAEIERLSGQTVAVPRLDR